MSYRGRNRGKETARKRREGKRGCWSERAIEGRVTRVLKFDRAKKRGEGKEGGSGRLESKGEEGDLESR